MDDSWSDDEYPLGEPGPSSSSAVPLEDTSSSDYQVTQLQTRIKSLQTLLDRATSEEELPDSSLNGKYRAVKPTRDDDTHYFHSYEHNGEWALTVFLR